MGPRSGRPRGSESIVADAQRFADFDVPRVQEVSAGHRQPPGSDGTFDFVCVSADIADRLRDVRVGRRNADASDHRPMLLERA